LLVNSLPWQVHGSDKRSDRIRISLGRLVGDPLVLLVDPLVALRDLRFVLVAVGLDDRCTSAGSASRALSTASGSGFGSSPGFTVKPKPASARIFGILMRLRVNCSKSIRAGITTVRI